MELAEAARSTVDRLRPAEHAAGWALTLRGIADVVQADHALLVVEDGSTAQPIIAESVGLRADAFDHYRSAAAAGWMRPLMRDIPYGTVRRSSDLIADPIFMKTARYTEAIRPANGFYALAARERLDRLSIFVAACRPRQSGNFAGPDAARFQALLPMLRETVSLHQSLGIFREHTAGLTHVLENLDCAVILLDAAQRPVFMNTRARDVAEARDGLLVGRSGLTTARTGETRSLRHAIASAVDARPACSASVYVQRDAARTPLKLDILPVGGGAGAHMTARVIVLIREPEAPRAFDREALIRSYDLTPREAELAILLATGHTLSGAAAVLKIGLSTVRWYLKHLFEKTETHRQGELIRLVVGGFANRSA